MSNGALGPSHSSFPDPKALDPEAPDPEVVPDAKRCLETGAKS